MPWGSKPFAEHFDPTKTNRAGEELYIHPIHKQHVKVRNGQPHPMTEPTAGIEWDENAAARYAVTLD